MDAFEALEAAYEWVDGLDEQTIVDLIETLDTKQTNLQEFFEWLAKEELK